VELSVHGAGRDLELLKPCGYAARATNLPQRSVNPSVGAVGTITCDRFITPEFMPDQQRDIEAANLLPDHIT
jgi:hypothetical protein